MRKSVRMCVVRMGMMPTAASKVCQGCVTEVCVRGYVMRGCVIPTSASSKALCACPSPIDKKHADRLLHNVALSPVMTRGWVGGWVSGRMGVREVCVDG